MKIFVLIILDLEKWERTLEVIFKINTFLNQSIQVLVNDAVEEWTVLEAYQNVDNQVNTLHLIHLHRLVQGGLRLKVFGMDQDW